MSTCFRLIIQIIWNLRKRVKIKMLKWKFITFTNWIYFNVNLKLLKIFVVLLKRPLSQGTSPGRLINIALKHDYSSWPCDQFQFETPALNYTTMNLPLKTNESENGNAWITFWIRSFNLTHSSWNLLLNKNSE